MAACLHEGGDGCEQHWQGCDRFLNSFYSSGILEKTQGTCGLPLMNVCTSALQSCSFWLSTLIVPVVTLDTGGYVLMEEKLPKYIVPDLTNCKVWSTAFARYLKPKATLGFSWSGKDIDEWVETYAVICKIAVACTFSTLLATYIQGPCFDALIDVLCHYTAYVLIANTLVHVQNCIESGPVISNSGLR